MSWVFNQSDLSRWGRQCGKTETQTEFAREYMAELWNEGDEQSRQLAEHYVQETEAHDALVCATKNDQGRGIPLTADERRASRQFSDELRKDCIWIAGNLGFNVFQWAVAEQRAIQRWERFYNEQRRD